MTHPIMRTTPSPKKLAANRRNALRSTGPTSAAGKRTASTNAIFHGLSRQQPSDEDSKAIADLALHIDLELGNALVSQQLATCLYAYEKVMQQEYAQALRQFQGKHPLAEDAELDSLESQMLFASSLANYANAERRNKRLSREERRDIKLFAVVGKFFTRAARHEAANIDRQVRFEQDALKRYFKRTSNQLIKCAKALG